MSNISKYNSLSEWKSADPNGYNAAYKHNLIDKICQTYNWNWRKGKYWTKEVCKKDAERFKTRMEWCKGSGSAYSTAVSNGWLDYCCEHMDIKLKKWSLEEIENDAKKYNTRTEWCRKSGSAYAIALKKGKDFFEKCVSHMKTLREDTKNYTKKQCIEQCKKYNSKSEIAKKRPGLYQYTKDKGWFLECCSHMNNRLSWNKKDVLQSALKCKSRQEWRKKDRKAYDASFNHDWYEEATKHMLMLTNVFTKKQCKIDSMKCKTLKEWREKYNKTYNFAYRKGWLKEISAHMPKLKKWSKNKIENIAKKYTKISEFKKNDSKAYSAASSKRYNMLSYLTKKYFKDTKRKTKWTKNLCTQNAKKFETISHWIKGSSSCYKTAKENGWLEECKKSFKKIKRAKWTKEECINDAKKCKTQREWIDKPGGAYQAAWKNNWLEECCRHMKNN